MLELINFTKWYGSFPALKIGSRSIPSGIFWIKGANGSGKSTFLRAIAGILSFNGDIVLENHISIKKNPVAYRKKVNFAEAEPLFPDFLTGTEMLKLFQKAKNASPGQADYCIESLSMNEYMNRPLGSYSSGMLKKLSLVLAFTGNPQLILLDEPLITLDKHSVATLYDWIIREHQTNGTSFMLSSHQDLDKSLLGRAIEIKVESGVLYVSKDAF